MAGTSGSDSWSAPGSGTGSSRYETWVSGAAAGTTFSFGYALRVGLLTASALALAFAVNLVLVSRLEEHVAQTRAFDQFRLELAQGTAPVGPRVGRHTIPLGTPMALLEIPSIGVKQIVSEGTTGSVLMNGPGHMRSTVFPGGVGTSVILGRSAAYGGPFGRIGDLRKGEIVDVITDVGTSRFRVVDVRRAGDLVPSLAPGQARLTLATATGLAFAPDGVVWVDADLLGSPLAAQRPLVNKVPSAERPLGVDPSALGAVLGWVTLLVLMLALGVWTWYRLGRARAWLVFSAPVLLVGLIASHQINLLLPNLT